MVTGTWHLAPGTYGRLAGLFHLVSQIPAVHPCIQAQPPPVTSNLLRPSRRYTWDLGTTKEPPRNHLPTIISALQTFYQWPSRIPVMTSSSSLSRSLRAFLLRHPACVPACLLVQLYLYSSARPPQLLRVCVSTLFTPTRLVCMSFSF